jgi:hypothetical protein
MVGMHADIASSMHSGAHVDRTIMTSPAPSPHQRIARKRIWSSSMNDHGRLAAAAAAEPASLSALHRLIVEGEYMAALRSDSAAPLLRIVDPGPTPNHYMTAVAQRVQTLLSGPQHGYVCMLKSGHKASPERGRTSLSCGSLTSI